jgi:hypothetical protein
MKATFPLFLALFVVGCASSADRMAPGNNGGRDASAGASAGLPEDAAKVVDKLAACSHFAGEFGGDNSARDREVTAAISQLHCETIDADVRGIVARYPGNKELLSALKKASEP